MVTPYSAAARSHAFLASRVKSPVAFRIRHILIISTSVYKNSSAPNAKLVGEHFLAGPNLVALRPTDQCKLSCQEQATWNSLWHCQHLPRRFCAAKVCDALGQTYKRRKVADCYRSARCTQKSICQRTRRDKTIPRPTLERSRRGEIRSVRSIVQ